MEGFVPRISLPELVQIEDLIEDLDGLAETEVLATVSHGKKKFPIHAIKLGHGDETSPIIGIFGGVHGLERIGTQIAISFLTTVVELLSWDRYFKTFLNEARLVFIPLINPGGMYAKRRANPNGVDLMRNAPVEAMDISPHMLPAGHRISSVLPWYRGVKDEPMEIEARATVDYVKKHFFKAKVSIALDVHSGFGRIDRLWFPFAFSKRPFPNLPEVYALGQLLDQTYPNHIYKLEPQSKNYRTHGDLWDYLYLEHRKHNPQNVFLPLTLELGSWAWVKKNPKQVLSLLGAFNPVIPHRYQRTLRRHLILFDFLLRATIGFDSWANLSPKERERLRAEALKQWYAY